MIQTSSRLNTSLPNKGMPIPKMGSSLLPRLLLRPSLQLLQLECVPCGAFL